MFQTGVWKYLKFDVQLYSVDFNLLNLFGYSYIALIQLHNVTCMFIECMKSILREKNYWK